MFAAIVALAFHQPQEEASATVKGAVWLAHRAPPRKRIRLEVEPLAPTLHPQGLFHEDLAVDEEGGVKWAFVFVKRGLEGLTFPPPKEPALSTFDKFVLAPRVLGLVAGQEWVVRSVDAGLRPMVVHNIHPLTFVNKETNVGLHPDGPECRRTFGKPEARIKAVCDIHPWERMWIHVLSHPFFAVTGADGRYEIKGLPPGRYTIEVWQEKCKPVEREIEVKAGQVRTLDFEIETVEPPPPRNWKPLAIDSAAGAVLLVLALLLFRRR